MSIFNTNKNIPVSYVYYKFTLDNKVIPLKDEEDYLQTFDEDHEEHEHDFIAQELNTSYFEINSVDSGYDKLIFSPIDLQDIGPDRVNNYFTAYIKATFPNCMEKNDIQYFYGDIILRVVLNSYDHMYLDLYTNEMQPKIDRIYDTATSQLDALKKLMSLI